MSDDSRFDWDGTQPAEPGAAPTAAGTSGAGWSRGRRIAIAGVAASVVLLGGGAVAVAATHGDSNPGGGYGYGYGYGGGGSGGAPRGEGFPGGATGRGGPTATAHKPHLDGTVKTVSSTVITIKDRDGFTRTIKLSSATKYSGGLTKAPAVGIEIDADGAVDADGTSLDATSITKDTHTPR
jgi:hypothetical protein